MTEKSEALRLAECLDEPLYATYEQMTEAAFELRRLYAERTAADGVVNDLAAKVRGLQTQRDALLEALKLARSIIGHPDDAHSQMIDAAIKQAEENT